MILTKVHWQYLYVFLQSNLLEIPFYYFGLRKFVPAKLTRSLYESERVLFFIAAVTAINTVTHPFIFFGIMSLKLAYLTNILLAEAFAFIAEGFFMWKILDVSFKRALLISALANLASWQLSPLLTFKIFG